jgi:hypothetical protein
MVLSAALKTTAGGDGSEALQSTGVAAEGMSCNLRTAAVVQFVRDHKITPASCLPSDDPSFEPHADADLSTDTETAGVEFLACLRGKFSAN